MKLIGESDGINWIWYQEFEIIDGVAKAGHSWRAHKYDEDQGEHPDDSVSMIKHDAHYAHGHGCMVTHVTFYFDDGAKVYPMYGPEVMKHLYEEHDARVIDRLVDDTRWTDGSIAKAVMRKIEIAHKIHGLFGATGNGGVY